MKYFLRSVKHFFSFAVMVCITILGFVWLNQSYTLQQALDPDSGMFQDNFVYKTLIFLAAVSVVYPLVSYVKRNAILTSSFTEEKDDVINLFISKGYIIKSESNTEIRFILKNQIARFMRLYEDEVVLSIDSNPLVLQGHRKDIYRLATAIEFRSRNR